MRAVVGVVLALALFGTASTIAGAQPAPPAPPFVIRVPDFGPEQAAVRIGTGTITAFVDGQRCASLDVARGSGTLQLGLPDQPEPCGRNGATVTFTDSAGRTLFTTLTVARGASADLTNFAPLPPSSAPGRTPAQVLPPKSGHGPNGAHDESRRALLLEAASLVALASALLAVALMSRGAASR